MIFSENQKEIITYKGNLIVKASAGAGKTATMVEKIYNEISENKNHKVIAAITFTIKAANEIKQRLKVDIVNHFIGTNNSFVIEEIINPFFKDVFKETTSAKFSTDYSKKINTFEDGKNKIINENLICSYTNNKKNFVFELGKLILENSQACKLYIKSKYFKIYVDEYQDCDLNMHEFFMYICDELNIELFVIGDDKQSIYMWRGAYPEAFNSICKKVNFQEKTLFKNYRSCQQIQNYSNILFNETAHLYKELDDNKDILWIKKKDNWIDLIIENIDLNKTTAILRYSNDNAKLLSDEFNAKGYNFEYIPSTPIDDISTDAVWLYFALAGFYFTNKYSIYDFISEIPSESNFSSKEKNKLINSVELVMTSISNQSIFINNVRKLADYLSVIVHDEYIQKLHDTLSNEKYKIAFNSKDLNNISITFHSSKGLEFEQVIIFTSDYRLNDLASINNHYVAVTRAKNKLIIIKEENNFNSNIFLDNLKKIVNQRKIDLHKLIKIIN